MSTVTLKLISPAPWAMRRGGICASSKRWRLRLSVYVVGVTESVIARWHTTSEGRMDQRRHVTVVTKVIGVPPLLGYVGTIRLPAARYGYDREEEQWSW